MVQLLDSQSHPPDSTQPSDVSMESQVSHDLPSTNPWSQDLALGSTTPNTQAISQSGISQPANEYSYFPQTSSTSENPAYNSSHSTDKQTTYFDLTNMQTTEHLSYVADDLLTSTSYSEYHEKSYLPQSACEDNIPANSCHDTYHSSLIENSCQSSLIDNSFYLQIDSESNANQLNDKTITSDLPVLDNVDQFNDNNLTSMQGLDNQPESEVVCKPTRTRCDSSESMDTLSSESSGEIFTSSYLDTVSSVESTSYLLKSDQSDEEVLSEATPITVPEVYFNTGYASSSSNETLDKEEKEESDSEMVYLPLLEEKDSSDEKDEVTIVVEDCSEEENKPESSTLTDFVPHLLIPIKEHDIVSFKVEEIEPSMYPKITNNITVADESFLFESQTSLWVPESGKNGARAATMQNLHERTSFLDLTEVSKVGRACQKALIFLKDDMSFGSIASLNKLPSNKDFDKSDPSQGISLIDGSKGINIIPSTRHTRNLVALSLCITLLFIAIGSVRNLQSSINHEGGVGVISMAVTFVGYMIGSIFSSSIVQNFQPRQCIILNLIPNLLYVAANIYPALWLMVPISFIQGVSSAIIWNAATTYITFLARGRAQKKNESLEEVSGRFYGVYCLIFQSNIIIGNLIASLVLMFGNMSGSIAESTNTTAVNVSLTGMPSEILAENVFYETENLTDNTPLTATNLSHLSICGGKFCQHFEIGGTGFSVSEETKYILFGIYIGCVVMSMLIAIFMLEPLNTNLFMSTMRPLQKVKSQLISLAKFSVDKNFLLLLPLCMYTTMQYGFVSAEFTKAYVTCPLGIHMVGYTMICLGVCGSLSSYLSGLLNKFTGRIAPIITAAILNLGSLIYMTKWQPTPDSLLPYFLIMGIWGVSDGVWVSQINIIMGVVFPDKFEEAFAGLRVSQGLGVAISFGYSSSLCMTYKIYILSAICVVGIIGHLIMEARLRSKAKLKEVTLKQTSV